MTQEQIIELLNIKIKEIQKKAKQDHNYNNERWRDYYSGVVKGLKDAQNIIGMLDK